MDIDKAIATQLANIEKRTGKTLAQLTKIVKGSGLTRHGELVAMLKSDLGMGHGDANTLVHSRAEVRRHVRRGCGRQGRRRCARRHLYRPQGGLCGPFTTR